MTMQRRVAALLAALALGLVACGPAPRPAVAVAPLASETAAVAGATNGGRLAGGKGSAGTQSTATASPASTGTAATATAVAAQTGPFVPNELGEIPILELHRVGATEGRWQITPDHLRALLADLYGKGFRPVDFRDVVARHIDIPRGYAAVVLTFDDADPSQFQWAPGGAGTTPDPSSAVGILWDFHLAHPDWGAAASFYVNKNPFGSDSAAKVAWLVAHGFEVGDHTADHVDMTKLDAAQMLEQVGGMAAWVQSAVPGYRVATLAYPYGFASHLPSTAWDGTVDGQTYHIAAALLVGAGPAPSPYSRQWSPLEVPRIQVADPSTLESRSTVQWVWAGWEPRLLANHGAALYVSDGDPGTVAVTTADRGDLATDVPPSRVVLAAAAPVMAVAGK
jgi:peptidoglycan/xylan/chitin deacetylase (PgdA/CDA1 family)